MFGKYNLLILLLSIITCFTQDTTDDQILSDFTIPDTDTVVAEEPKTGSFLRGSENSNESNSTDTLKEVATDILIPISDSALGEGDNSSQATDINNTVDDSDTLITPTPTQDDINMLSDLIHDLEIMDDILDDLIANEPPAPSGFLRSSRAVQTGNGTDDNSTIIDSLQSVMVSIQEPISNQINLIVSWVSGDAKPENSTDITVNETETVQDEPFDMLDDMELGIQDIIIDVHNLRGAGDAQAIGGITVILEEPIVAGDLKAADNVHDDDGNIVVSFSMDQIKEAIVELEGKQQANDKPFFARLLDLFGGDQIEVVAESLNAEGKEDRSTKDIFYDGL